MSLSRLQKELYEVRHSDALASIGGSAGPIKKSDLYHWKACFIGPKIVDMMVVYLDY